MKWICNTTSSTSSGYEEYHNQYHIVCNCIHTRQVSVVYKQHSNVWTQGSFKSVLSCHTMKPKKRNLLKKWDGLCKLDLKHQKERTIEQSPARKMKWQSASSNYPVMYLTPHCRKLGKKNAQVERCNHKAVQIHWEPKTDVTLNDDQYDYFSYMCL